MNDRLADFRREYSRAVDELLPQFTSERLDLIAKHNAGWGSTRINVEGYLRASETRYVKALEVAESLAPGASSGRLLDVGGFMGAFPLAMSRLGTEVTLTERYSYYDGAFDELRVQLEQAGVTTLDEDLTDPAARLPTDRFDLVTAMAIIEHLANSPKPLLDNCRSVLSPGGRLLVEVPNIAFWPKRLAMLTGRSPHPPLRDVFDSATPFTGHHREYTWEELAQVLEWSGLSVDTVVSFNYTPQEIPPLWRPLQVWPSRRERCREILMAAASIPPLTPATRDPSPHG